MNNNQQSDTITIIYSKLSYGIIKNKYRMPRYATVNSFCKSSEIKKLIPICILTSDYNIKIRG